MESGASMESGQLGNLLESGAHKSLCRIEKMSAVLGRGKASCAREKRYTKRQLSPVPCGIKVR
jgi:hypothetical protein